MSLTRNLEQAFFPWRRRQDEPPPFGLAALIGFAAVAGPAYFVGAAVLYKLGAPIPVTAFNFVSPLALAAGMVLCAWLNIGAMVTLPTHSNGQTPTLRFHPRFVNTVLLVVVAFVFGGLAYHAAMEHAAGW